MPWPIKAWAWVGGSPSPTVRHLSRLSGDVSGTAGAGEGARKEERVMKEAASEKARGGDTRDPPNQPQTSAG